jgi:hypothetical protein
LNSSNQLISANTRWKSSKIQKMLFCAGMLIRGIILSALIFSSLLCRSQRFSAYVPDSLGMTNDYQFIVFFMHDEMRITYSVTLANVKGDQNNIVFSPYTINTQNKALFASVLIHSLAHYYNYYYHGEVTIDTVSHRVPIDSNFWDASPDLAKVIYKGGHGYTVQKAIIIKNASTLKEGVGAEYAYIEKLIGERGVKWKPSRQYLHPDGRKIYDVLEVNVTGSNEARFFCFDITHFFGKNKL